MELRIRGLSYELGRSRPVEGLPELEGRPELGQRLAAAGLVNYRLIEASEVARTVVRCVERTLTEGELHPDDFDTILISSSTIWEQAPELLRALMQRLSLTRAYPYGVTLSECANPMACLRFADGLISTGASRLALVIVVDSMAATTRSRVVPPDSSIYSDSVVSFAIGAELDGDYRVLDVYSHSESSMWCMDPKSPQYLRLVTNGMAHTFRETLRRGALATSDLAYVAANNYSNLYLTLLQNVTGVDEGRLNSRNIARVGHAYANDTLINLRDFALGAAGGRRLAMLFAAGIGTWGSALIETMSPARDVEP